MITCTFTRLLLISKTRLHRFENFKSRFENWFRNFNRSQKYFLVANQATYVFITIQYYWRELGYNPAGFESACIFMCFMGSGSMGFLLITQILQVLKGGTQYFPGNGKISLKNVIEFWTAQTGKLPEDNNQKNHFTV